MLDDGEPFEVGAGDIVYIPIGVYHSTFNRGWEPMRVLALYNPGGSELGLATLPDFKGLPAGEHQAWTRSE
jgi:mannose-6-phosphate isomerase-like protein (cupin superfamily)